MLVLRCSAMSSWLISVGSLFWVINLKILIKIITFSLALFLAVGCTQRYQKIGNDFKRSIWPTETNYSPLVQQISRPSILVNINGGPQAFVVLAYQETNPAGFAAGIDESMLWQTADKVLLKTAHGRLYSIRNIGVNSLISSYFDDMDPFKSGLLAVSDGSVYRGFRSWWENDFVYQSYATEHTFKVIADEELTLSLATVNTRRIVEHVTIPTINQSFTNTYWVSLATGRVVKSEQYVLPGKLPVVIESGRPIEGECNDCY